MQKKEYSGRLGDLSPEQDSALQIFRAEVQASGANTFAWDDAYLLRFLRARKFDLVKTREMWNNFLKFRKEYNVDEISSYVFSEVDEVKQSYPHGYFKTDKLGRPVYIERVGQLKLQQLFKCTTEDRIVRYWIQSYERLVNHILPSCSKVKGMPVEQTCTILDLKGGSMKIMSKQVYDFVKLASSIGQNYYPEIMGKMFIVNAPLLFSGVWAMVKPWIDEKTRAKIEIIGSKYEPKVLDLIDANNLPDFLGGKCTEADYGANLSTEKGPWVSQVNETITTVGDDENDDRTRDAQEIADLKNALAGMSIAGGSNTQKIEDSNYSAKNIIPSDTPLNTQIDDS